MWDNNSVVEKGCVGRGEGGETSVQLVCPKRKCQGSGGRRARRI